MSLFRIILVRRLVIVSVWLFLRVTLCSNVLASAGMALCGTPVLATVDHLDSLDR
jgi:hypothetical protein